MKMAAKIREKDGFYWVVVHHQGRRKWKKIGKDKREALKVVHKVNAELALGTFSLDRPDPSPTVEAVLWRWYEDYKPTFSASYAQLAEINIRRHLVPALGKLRLSEVSERRLLVFIGEKTVPQANPRRLRAGLTPNTRGIAEFSRRVPNCSPEVSATAD